MLRDFLSAQTFTGATSIILKVNQYVLNPIITVLFGVALVVFLWGIVEYLWQADSESGRELGRKHIGWGLFGLVVMFAVFAVMQVIARSIGAEVPATIGR
ncbi:MAG: hypothetical protein HYS74_02315 [Parcubacteria group bacterium]|nr:hypothetical protein [Parcubacteria group bacterium]